MKNLDEPRKEAYRSLLVAHARLTEAIDKRMTESGKLPLTWYDVLVTLEYAEAHRLRMTELADRIVLSKSGLTRLLDRLVERGFVERVTCPSDRRVSYAVLTEAGVAAREESWPLYSSLVAELFGAQMSDEETETLCRVLKKTACAVTELKKHECISDT